nr:GNAT family N-acetyltransferase [Ancylothrix sp. D3o]
MHRRPLETGFEPTDSLFSVREALCADLPALADLLSDSFHSREGLMGWTFPFLRMGIYEDLRHRLRDRRSYYVCFVALASVGSSPENRPLVAGTVEMSLRSSFSFMGLGSHTHQKSGLPGFSDFNSQFPYVSNLAVGTGYRRLGVAKLLLAACERVALQWGYSSLYLHVLENNHHARRLYFKVGYRVAGIDAGGPCWLLRQPRRILLRKSLNLNA